MSCTFHNALNKSGFRCLLGKLLKAGRPIAIADSKKTALDKGRFCKQVAVKYLKDFFKINYVAGELYDLLSNDNGCIHLYSTVSSIA